MISSSVSREGKVTPQYASGPRISYSEAKNEEFNRFIRQSQMEYPSWWTVDRVVGWLRALPEHTSWNCFICVAVLCAITWVLIDFTDSPAEKHVVVVDVVYNALYGVHVVAMAYEMFVSMQHANVHWYTIFGFLLDFLSYLHYAIVVGNYRTFKLVCYYLRLHRPFKYLCSLSSEISTEYLNSSSLLSQMNPLDAAKYDEVCRKSYNE